MHLSQRHVVAAGCILVLHGAALWALQSGLLQRTAETVVPVALVSELITPPAPQAETPPAPVPPKPLPVRHVVVPRPAPPQPVAPRPAAVRETTPEPQAPTGSTEPQPAPPPVAAPVAAAAPSPALAAKVELPTKDADYLQNPMPPYPPMSFRLNEQGLVTVHVLIGANGVAQDAQVEKSSGYQRLDAAALKAALSWRYRPGTRGGVPEAMWFNVPVNWTLNRK